MGSFNGITSFLCLFHLCLLVFVSASKSEHHRKHHEKECTRVQLEFSHKKIGSRELVPDFKVHDSSLSVCFNGAERPGHKSCCTKQTESKYVEAAGRFLKDSLRSSNAYLKKLVMESLAQFQESILDLLEDAQNRTSQLLTHVHNIPWDEHHGAVSDLFLDMEQYARQQRVSLHDSINTFFARLFPAVFYNILSDPSLITYDQHYKNCLFQNAEDIQPFDNVPRRLAHNLAQAFHRARAFVNALSVISEAINATDHIEFDQNCRDAATRLQYCSHCDGNVDAKPCHGFCLNVIGGCLATVLEISPGWDALIADVERLTSSMTHRYSLEAVLSQLDKTISDGILISMDDGPRIYEEVHKLCSHLTTKLTVSHRGHHHKSMATKSRRRPSPSYSLMEQLESVLKKLIDSRGIYNRLASEICSQSMLYEQDFKSSKCWNGQKIGDYTKISPESTFIAQAKANPEVKVDVRPNYKLLAVRDKLFHMRKNLSALLTDEMMQGDRPEELYASGERRISNTNVEIDDDEDLYDPSSGSGSGDDSTSPSPPPVPPGRGTKYPPTVGSASLPALSFSLVLVCLAYVKVVLA